MGSLLGGEEKTTQTSEDRVYLPGYAEGPLRQSLQLATQAAGQGFTPYTADRVAGFTPDELQAFAMTRGLAGQTAPQFQQALNTSQQVAQQGLGGIDPSLIQSYMNPYITNVLDVNRQRSLQDFDRQKQALQAQAAQAGSFGGSRFGIAETNLYDQFRQRQAEQEANLLMQGYQGALGAAQQGLGLAGQQAGLQGQLAAQGLQSGLQGIGALEAVGAQQRGLAQQGLDVNFQEFLRQQAFPYEQAQFLAGISQPIAATVAGRDTTTETVQESSPSPLGAALGIASMAMGIPGVGAALGGGLSSLGGMMGGSIGGGLMGAGTGLSAGLSGSQIGRMAVGGMRGMQGPGFEQGGLVTDQKYQDGGLIGPDSPLPLDFALDGPDYYDVLAFIESSNNPKAVNLDSGAAGLYQFLPATAKRYNLDDPTDPKEARRAVEEMTEENRRILTKKLGYEPSEFDLYLAHQQGPTGAYKLLSNPDKKASEIVGKGAVLRNAGNPDMAAREFADMWTRKYMNAITRDGERMGGSVGIPLPARRPEFQEGGLIGGLSRLFRRSDDLPAGRMSAFQRLGGMNQQLQDIIGSRMQPRTPGETPLQGVGRGLNNVGMGFEKAVTAPVALGYGLPDTVAGGIERLNRPGFTEEEAMAQGIEQFADTPEKLRALHAAQNRLLSQVPAQVRQDDPQDVPKSQVALEQLKQQVARNQEAAGKPLSGRTMTFEDVLARSRKQVTPEDSNRALMAFGAHLLSSSDNFFKALGGATTAYQTAKDQEKAQAVAKEKAIRDMAAQEFQKELNARQMAANEQIMQQKMEMAPYELRLKQAQLAAALQRAGGDDKDLDRALKLYESMPFEQPEVILKRLGMLKQGLGQGSTAGSSLTPEQRANLIKQLQQ